jgi:hypothetical protein
MGKVKVMVNSEYRQIIVHSPKLTYAVICYVTEAGALDKRKKQPP